MADLALAGAVSGMGEAVGRGLLNLQSGQIQRDLLQERDAMERARLELTFGHDVSMLEKRGEQELGILQKRLEGEEAYRSRLEGQRQTFELGEAEKERAFKGTEAEKTREAEVKKQQADIGKDITLQAMRIEEARELVKEKSELKLDPAVKAKLDFLTEELKGLQKQSESPTLTEESAKGIRQRIDEIRQTVDGLLGGAPISRAKPPRASLESLDPSRGKSPLPQSPQPAGPGRPGSPPPAQPGVLPYSYGR